MRGDEFTRVAAAAEKIDSLMEEQAIGHRALLHRFAPTGSQLPRGQSPERFSIDQDQTWLMKNADEVLARRQIYRGLAPHGRIDLREQSHRRLNQGRAAPVTRGT